jgi:diguanylate cyclase (GGDEF)-like protein
MTAPIQLLCQGASPPDLTTSALGPFIVQCCAQLTDVPPQLAGGRFDALLLRVDNSEPLRALLNRGELSHAVLETALIVLVPEPSAADITSLLQLGVQEVVPTREAHPERIALALRQSVERKRLERAAKPAYATDLGTGLPNHAQLMEHLTHLLALREREPAPMALLVLRIDGLAMTAAGVGLEAAHVLRRKIAVRLRSMLRASDVVAALGHDRFAVLLAWIDDAAAGARVADKLVQSLQRPLHVAGRDVMVAVAAGIARYPADACDADTLLRLAASDASQSNVRGRTGLMHPGGPGGSAAAANDETPRSIDG